MSSTNTNKQPVFADRPLFDRVRVTTQIVGSSTSNTLFVQGGQAPSILVDMDAALSDDNNSGGVIDSITIVRNDAYRAADYTLDATTSGTAVSLVSGQIVTITTTGAMNTGTASGIGYYTYTGATTITGKLGAFNYSGGIGSGFLYQGISYGYQPTVTFAFYQTRGTTTPIPASAITAFCFLKQFPLVLLKLIALT